MKKISKIYIGYACYPPFVIYGTEELTLKEPLSEADAIVKAEKSLFEVGDFKEDFEEKLSYLPTAYKYVYSVGKSSAEEWAYYESMYGGE